MTIIQLSIDVLRDTERSMFTSSLVARCTDPLALPFVPNPTVTHVPLVPFEPSFRIDRPTRGLEVLFAPADCSMSEPRRVVWFPLFRLSCPDHRTLVDENLSSYPHQR